MSLTGIFSSPHQRRTFLALSTLIICVCLVMIWCIYYFFPNTRGWNTLSSLLVSIVASAVFALVSALYLTYFFLDPTEISKKTVLLPPDIGQALRDVATSASDYRIYVRTGRHFRADILPILIQNAIRDRRAIGIEVILLDFRDVEVCEKYASYRRTASFDRHLWDTEYVQKEVMATILELSAALENHSSLFDIRLFLSNRLSTFRIEGSSQALIITREDPNDMAARYLRSDRDHGAFITEFNWIRDSASPVSILQKGASSFTLEDMFGELPVIARLKDQATNLRESKSPYAR